MPCVGAHSLRAGNLPDGASLGPYFEAKVDLHPNLLSRLFRLRFAIPTLRLQTEQRLHVNSLR